MTIRIDEKRIFEVIEQRKPMSVALNGPEGLIPKLQDAADHVTEKFGIEAYVIGDTCWGSCDLNTHAADMLGADILFNIGHTIAMETFGDEIFLFSTDFPHRGTSWPNGVQEAVEPEWLSEQSKSKILGENALRMFTRIKSDLHTPAPLAGEGRGGG